MNPNPCPRPRRRTLILAASLACAGAVSAQTQLPKVEVVGVTPVEGLGVPKDQVPGNVQSADANQMRQSQALNLPELMTSRMASVTVNEMQGNPYQLDVNYRGFTASPLLGTPQGLSVFLDGVRINEAFGDVVNWDLIPRNALASMTLMPGSNPLFGLNTLGGALSLQTKSGKTHPGTEAEFSTGSFGRVDTEVSHGDMLGKTLHLFIAAAAMDETGWRDDSPSHVRQFFARLGDRVGPLRWDLSAAYGHTKMIGNGPLPESMLAQRRDQVYTTPDITSNEAMMLTLNTSYKLTPWQTLSGTAYLRKLHTHTLNGDLNDDYDPPVENFAAVEHRTRSRQHADGLALQWSLQGDVHQAAVGATLDRTRSGFRQTSTLGQLDAARDVVPTDAAQIDALLHGRSRTTSLFGTDTIELSPDLHWTVSGRFNRTRVQTIDTGRIDLGLPTTLDADAVYTQFNPATGLTWKMTPGVTAYGGFSQGNRAPSPIELGCSDPASPCVLPNALQSDPPLKQVVSRTLEFGFRGGDGDGLRWNASAYRTTNDDDILFISNSLAAGYFKNFGRTRREGLEFDVSKRDAALEWSAGYSLMRATYQSSACVVAEGNSSAETSAACTGAGEIEVRPGDRIPGLPMHNLKLGLAWRPNEAWRLAANVNAASFQYVRGNENNLHHADGSTFSGSGKLPGYALLNLSGEWRLTPALQLFARLNNVFDRRYSTGGLLASNAFDSSGRLLAPNDRPQAQFVTPGAPRAAWIGLRWSLEGDDDD